MAGTSPQFQRGKEAESRSTSPGLSRRSGSKGQPPATGWQLGKLEGAVMRPVVVVALLVTLDATILTPISSVRRQQVHRSDPDIPSLTPVVATHVRVPRNRPRCLLVRSRLPPGGHGHPARHRRPITRLWREADAARFHCDIPPRNLGHCAYCSEFPRPARGSVNSGARNRGHPRHEHGGPVRPCHPENSAEVLPHSHWGMGIRQHSQSASGRPIRGASILEMVLLRQRTSTLLRDPAIC